MIHPLKLVVACALVAQAFAETPGQSAARQSEEWHQKGLVAEKANDVATAKEAYAKAVKLNPDNANARYSLGQLAIHAPEISAKAREAKFGAVTIPLFQLDNATLQEALDALNAIVLKESKDQVTPNFVIQDPKAQLASVKLSMNLKNMPAKGVMKYLMDQSSAKARYDEHAVVVTPR